MEDRTRARMCAGCSRTIADPYVLYAIDRFWHHACLQCHFCGVPLANSGRTCFFRDGRLLCRDDYIRLYGKSGICSTCHDVIQSTEMVIRCKERVYHVCCFKCSVCCATLTTGDTCHLVQDRILCDRDYQSASVCTLPDQN